MATRQLSGDTTVNDLGHISRSLDCFTSNFSKQCVIRQKLGYCRLLIGNHTLTFDWCHFWWPWSTFEGHFSLGCHFHVHFSDPWHAFASHGLPAIAELLVALRVGRFGSWAVWYRPLATVNPGNKSGQWPCFGNLSPEKWCIHNLISVTQSHDLDLSKSRDVSNCMTNRCHFLLVVHWNHDFYLQSFSRHSTPKNWCAQTDTQTDSQSENRISTSFSPLTWRI